MQLLPLTFDNVSKKYGQRTVLNELSFTVSRGEFLSIVGNSGIGKSTIIRLIMRIEKPTSGVISHGSYHGESAEFNETGKNDISRLNSTDLQHYRRSIGVVFQECKLIPGKTVFENVAFPLEACGFSDHSVIENTKEALEKIGILHLQDRHSEQLSGGEAQRVALARAIVHKPQLILADEPTGHLDRDNAAIVLKNLLTINMDGTAVILFTHNEPLTKLTGQRTIVLERPSTI